MGGDRENESSQRERYENRLSGEDAGHNEGYRGEEQLLGCPNRSEGLMIMVIRCVGVMAFMVEEAALRHRDQTIR